MLKKTINFFQRLSYRGINYILPIRCLSCATLIHSGFKSSNTSQDLLAVCSKCWSDMTFISHPYCDSCGRALDYDTGEKQLICNRCFMHKPRFDKSRSIVKFNEYSKKIIHNFKYYDKIIIAKFFARLMQQNYSTDFSDIDLIIPVPMHKLKRLMRMYNQSQILAQEIAIIFNKPCYNNILKKSRWTKAQSSLQGTERQKNLVGSFVVDNKMQEFLKGCSILLVDDVLTTGSTINECSKILKQCGAAKVYVVTIAST